MMSHFIPNILECYPLVVNSCKVVDYAQKVYRFLGGLFKDF